jgi:hypothetical protein
MPPDPEIEPPAPAEPDRESPQLAEDKAATITNGFSRSNDRSHDSTAARIVAMKMALDGSSRDDISAHLEDNYEVDGSEKLLDDVMARAKR